MESWLIFRFFVIGFVSSSMAFGDMPIYNLIHVLSVCPNGYPQGYTLAASGAHKAYKMFSQKVNFNQAKQACEDEGSVLSMPRTVEDISDIKEFDREYSTVQLINKTVKIHLSS